MSGSDSSRLCSFFLQLQKPVLKLTVQAILRRFREQDELPLLIFEVSYAVQNGEHV